MIGNFDVIVAEEGGGGVSARGWGGRHPDSSTAAENPQWWPGR